MTIIRSRPASIAGALVVGALASGCASAENKTRATATATATGTGTGTGPPTPDGVSSLERPSRTPRQPSPSEATDHGAGSRVPVLMRDDQAPVAADLERLARSFVSYAVGGSDTFPHRNSVTMLLGGEQVLAVDDIVAALSTRRIWQICPADWEVYGASSCPVDLLGPVKDAAVNDASLVYSARAGPVVCAPARTGPVPSGRLVVLRPEAPWRTCASDFALVLAADDRGRLRSIDLTLSEP